MVRFARILILKKEEINEKNSYECRVYKSVDDRSLSLFLNIYTTAESVLED